MFYVYTLTLKTSFPERVYVGRSHDPEQRFRDHISGKSKCGLIVGAIRKFGTEAFELSVVSAHRSSDKAFEEERAHVRRLRKAGVTLLNQTDGGKGAYGIKRTKESLQKTSVALKGRRLSKETRAKMSEVRRGVPGTPRPKPTAFVELNCAGCGDQFNRRARVERSVQKTRGAGPFCSIQCRNRAAAEARYGYARTG